MKLKSLALLTGAIALHATTSAQAVNLDVECDVDVYISGASAQDNTLVAQVQNLMLQTGEVVTGVPHGSVFRGADDNSWRFIIGEIDPAQISGTFSATNQVFCVHKRSEGGSGWGVAPVIQGSGGGSQTVGTPINFMTGIDCDETMFTCDQEDIGESILVSPDAGLSDVEPAVFNSVNTPANPAVTAGEEESAQNTALDPVLSPMTQADIDGLEVFQQAMFPFGVAVNPQFYAALQVCQGLYPSFAAQEADADAYERLDTMPSLTHSQVVSIYTGFAAGSPTLPCDNIPPEYVAANVPAPFTDLENVYTVAVGSGRGPSSPVTQVCRRTNGSGTHAQFRLKVLGFGCQAGSVDDFATTNTGATQFIENSGSGDMANCIAGSTTDRGITSTTVNWKIGFQATDKVEDFVGFGAGVPTPPGATSEDESFYRFVKIDGQAPTLAATAYGGWFDAVQATLQRRAGATADDRNYYHEEVNLGNANDVEIFLDQLITNFGAIGAITNFPMPDTADWYGGSLAINTNLTSATTCNINDGFDPVTNPCAAVSHQPTPTAELNNCIVPINNAPAILDSL